VIEPRAAIADDAVMRTNTPSLQNLFRGSLSMLQQLVQTLPTIHLFHTNAPRHSGADSWLSSSFDLHHGLTVTELPTVFADTMPAWMPGKLSPTSGLQR
jgi:hypothetical protein